MTGTLKTVFFITFAQIITCLQASAATPAMAVSQRDSSVERTGSSGDSMGALVSQDGRYVIFTSVAADLLAAQPSVSTRPVPDVLRVYLRDRLTQQTTLLASNLPGVDTGVTSFLPVELSPDNRHLLLETTSISISPTQTASRGDVWMLDLTTGGNTLVSVNTNGAPAAGLSESSTMSPDGRFVAFVSSAHDLSSENTNPAPQIYVRDLQLGTTILASSVPGASAPYIKAPVLSDNGRYVLFFSFPTGSFTTSNNVYLHDFVLGTTVPVSIFGRTNVPSSSGAICGNHLLSSDGNYIVYSLLSYVFQMEVSSGATTIITTNALPAPWTSDYVRSVAMTPDGRFVSYVGTGGTNVFLWDRASGNTSSMASNLPPAGLVFESPKITPDGRYVFVSASVAEPFGDYNLLRWDTASGTVTSVTIDDDSFPASLNPLTFDISTNGQVIAFDTPDSNLTVTDHNHCYDVFARDFTRSTNELISARDASNVASTGNLVSSARGPGLSANGRFLVFTSFADDLIPNDRNTNFVARMFLRDLIAGTNALIQAPPDSVPLDPVISGDAGLVAFSASSSNTHDIWQYDTQSGMLSLDSAATNGLAHTNGNYVSSAPAIGPDGRFILFHSSAPDIAPGITGVADNLFVHDNLANTNFALTHNSNPAASYLASLSPDGTLAGFLLNNAFSDLTVVTLTNNKIILWEPVNSVTALSLGNTNLAYVAANQLFVIDLATSNSVLVSPAAPTRPSAFSLGADGRYLVFSTKQALTPDDVNSNADVYLFDTTAGTNFLISRNYLNGQSADGASDWAQISSDNRFVAYRSSASDIVPGDTNDFPDIFLYDRLTRTTTLVSTDATGDAPANQRSVLPLFSADAKSLFFGSWSGNMVAGDYNQGEDIFSAALSGAAMADSDGDGMGDTWEMRFFESLDRNGAGDFDGDGASDLSEFLAGTDPTDPGSYLHLEFSTDQAGAALLKWGVAPDRAYRVEYKDDLGEAQWSDLGAPITIIGSAGYAFDGTRGPSQRFYRLVLVN